MDIEQLKTIINDNIASDASGRRILSVSGATLQSATLTDLFSSHLGGDNLTVQLSKDVEENPDSIVVIGTSEQVVFSRSTVTARFLVLNDEVALDLTARPAGDWSFSDSFPELAETLLPVLSFGSSAAFHLASYQVSTAIPPGLSFGGPLRLDGGLAPATWLLDDKDELTVTGSITRDTDGNPIMGLAAVVAGPIDLGFFELQEISFEVISEMSEATAVQPSELTAFVSFSSTIVFDPGNNAVSIPISATSFLNSPWVQFQADLNEALDAGLEELSALANDADLSSLVPNSLPLADLVALTDLILVVDLAERKLASVRIGVGTQQPWSIVEDVLSVETLGLLFVLDNPMSEPKLWASFSGEIAIEQETS